MKIVQKMEPISRSQLQVAYDLAQEKIRDEYIQRIVNQIYSAVIGTATNNKETKEYIYKDDSHGLHPKLNLGIISEKVLERLKILFPDCTIKFIQETPVDAIFQDRKRLQKEPRSAIIVDWS